MFRLRTLLFVCFGVVALIPVFVLGVWVSDWAVKKEYTAVQEKHLLVAKNLTSALSRYAADVEEVLRLAHRQMHSGQSHSSQDLDPLLEALHFSRIYQIDQDDRLHSYFESSNLSDDNESPHSAQLLHQIETQIDMGELDLSFLPVQVVAGTPVVPLALKHQKGILIAELKTDYFLQLQQDISFGRKGHAAIVDGIGRVLAHPRQQWVIEAKDISAVAPVARMIQGEQGVSFFYSPALEADMVAGFSSVPETGWGVMVPQPLSELHDHAIAIVRIALAISVAGIAFALFIAWLLSGFISKPVGEVARIAKLIASHKTNVDKVAATSPATLEMNDLVDSFNRMTAEVTSKTRALEFLANHDPLTQLPNRTYLKAALTEQLIESKKSNTHFGLLFIDLDEFKEVNDTLGHGYGDLLLKGVAQRIQQQVGELGIVSRQGGDEFAILLEPNLPPGTAENLAKSITKSIQKPFTIEEDQLFIGVSIGIAHYPKHAQDVTGLLRAADLAMYAVKADDSLNYRGFSRELQVTLSERKQLEKALRKALKQEDFVLYYQPRVEPISGKITAFEALVRWQHPENGVLLPSGFIEVAERTGEILALGRWVIEQAISDVARWCAEGYGEVKVSINLSERQFHSPDLISDIERLCEEHQVKPSQIEFEVTESLAMEKPAKAVAVLLHLKARGFRVSIDDFGQGFSSLARLKQLPVDKIKIDKAFVQGVGPHDKIVTKDAAIVEHILHLAEGLGMSVVAEGVETLQQLEFLQRIKCREVQGFIYSPAVPWQEALVLLAQTKMIPRVA
ncbi:MAG: putative bifunctional diguanylate cyclase/phosphodiesterase [Pontibacterium sp.]